MKKLSTYFIASVFFIAIWPKECDWPNPNEDGPIKVTAKAEQQAPQSTIEIVNYKL